MSTYTATIHWQHTGNRFTQNEYSRKHEWEFDGGITVSASASPEIVPEPFSDPAAVDPEEAFIASLSSCHMLWFLSIASREGYIVDDYTDDVQGKMEKNQEGKLAITEVILRPVVRFGGDQRPDQAVFDELHHRAHQRCFIAHSVRTAITIDATMNGTS